MSHAPTAFFDLGDSTAYGQWRARVLDGLPASTDDLRVDVRDPRRLSHAERDALLARCARSNMAVYASGADAGDDRGIPRALGAQLGLHTLDVNYLADDDGIAPLSAADSDPQRARADFIPYTNRAINWHTDGYYNPTARTVRAMLLHCVRRAESGGENRLLDHRLAYLRLRDENPAHIRALTAPDAMTIPARTEGPDAVEARPAQPGPVFSVDPDGHLHMRYTARTRSIAWKDDAATRAAVSALERLLSTEPAVVRLRLEPGMGLVCNNVLHDRSAFTDSPRHTRLLLRARYYEHVAAVRDPGPRAAAGVAAHA